MREKSWYIKNTPELNDYLEEIKMNVPCFITREYVEMDYSKVSILAREEDMPHIEDTLAPLV